MPARRGHEGSRASGDGPASGDRSGADRLGVVGEAVAATDEQVRAIPEAAVARLAVYLRVLSSLSEQGVRTVSSEELATGAGVNSAKLRKDLSYVGSYGTRGVGYEVVVLERQVARILGLTSQHLVAVVGIGNLGHALANYGGFSSRGFPVAALFDVDEDLTGVPVGGIPVDHIDDMSRVCADRRISVGVIATPTAAAQGVADRLVEAGVRCVLNFAPVVLQVPADVEVRKVDLAVEMQILSFHSARNADSVRVAQDGEHGVNGQPVPAAGEIGGMVVGR